MKSIVRHGRIRGTKIVKGVSSVTHLLFADDSLFFCQANNRNCRALNDIFQVYERSSGQMINASKSMMTSGSRIPGDQQNRLKSILGIQNKGGGGKYPCLPEQFGRKKSEMFKNITEAVRKRTSSWSSRLLSPVGKEVLLKSVAISMPVYYMSCFKIPSGVVKEITSIISSFWWEKDQDKRGIPWVAWKKLQLSKKEGGLGSRDLENFNDALLAKQDWQLLKYPSSLFTRLFKAKYYRDGSVLEAKSQRYQSFGWSYILVGLDLIKKGVCFNVGSEENIRVFQENWLPSDPLRPAEGDIISPMIVADLIRVSYGRRTWNKEYLQTLNDADRSLNYTSLLQKHMKNWYMETTSFGYGEMQP
ncbi:uncharacterized protein LOC112086123 [Eutrema salsugineum]|uniref:uncharacterized protein LOC112086123 n=1 Tax=Eutrema salsugineum TaxID=72664 RepID=UPI000CED5FA4|nr:uncharacterized protein LOC112086123 [Eutrema salsugineum]